MSSGDEMLVQGGPYDRIIDACGAPMAICSIFIDHTRTNCSRLFGATARYGAIGALAGRQETRFHQTMLHALRASIESSSHFTLEDLIGNVVCATSTNWAQSRSSQTRTMVTWGGNAPRPRP